MRLGLVSSAMSQVKGLEEMALIFARGGSDQIFEHFPMKDWSGIGITCPEKWWSHRLWKCLRGIWMWHWEILFKGDYGGAGLD